MRRYVVERDLPGVGKLDREQLKRASLTSCDALAKLHGKVQWVQSYVTQDKTFCIYLADGEASIHEHGRLSGFPVTVISEAPGTIDPMTAFS